MKFLPLSILLTLVIVLSLCLVTMSCNGNDDDDDDDDGGPSVPHDFTSSSNCLASDCHQGKHGGKYDDDLIPNKCLECHGGTPVGEDDDDTDTGSDDDDDSNAGDDDTGIGDDDSGDDDTGGEDGPGIPHSFNDASNCLSAFCHRGNHSGQYNGDPIPGKCLECHQ